MLLKFLVTNVWLIGLIILNCSWVSASYLWKGWPKNVATKQLLQCPPRMCGIPYLGSIVSFAFYGCKFNSQHAPPYGPLVVHKIGPKQDFITLNDCTLAQTVLRNPCCGNRPKMLAGSFKKCPYPAALPFVNKDQSLAERRKILLKSVVASATQKFMDQQTAHLLSHHTYVEMDKIADNKLPWLPRKDMRHVAFNLVFGALFGPQNQVSKDSVLFTNVDKLFTQFVDLFAVAGLSTFFNTFGMEDRMFSGALSKFNDVATEAIRLFEPYVEDGIARFRDETQTKNTFFDRLYENTLLLEGLTPDVDGSSRLSEAQKRVLISDVWVIVLAAVDTTAHNLEAALAYIAKDSALQQAIYEELLSQFVEPRDHNAKLHLPLRDIHNCPKFRAFVSETLRMAVSGPRALPRTLTEDCYLGFDKTSDGRCKNIDFRPLRPADGMTQQPEESKKEFNYVIPKDYIIEPNLEYIMAHDKRIWGNPQEFDINRWLITDDNGELSFRNNHESMPFSTGVRSCPGKPMAMRELQSFLANLILNYQVTSTRPDAPVTYKFQITKSVEPQIPAYVTKRTK